MSQSLVFKLPYPTVSVLQSNGKSMNQAWYDFIVALATEARTSDSDGGIVIRGDENEVQLKVLAYNTQTNNIIEVYDSSGVLIYSLSNSGNITISGTVDGRDISVDGTKLDTIESGADVTDSTNVVAALSSNFLPSVTPASDDEILIQDKSNSYALSTITLSTLTASVPSTVIQVDGSAVSTGVPTLDFDGTDFTLTESPTDDFDITIKDSGINHDATTNFVANKHIDHTTVSVSAGSGLTGGGTIAANRTLSVDIPSQTTVTAALGDLIMVADASDSNNIKKVTVQTIGETVTSAVSAYQLIATQTANNSSVIDFTGLNANYSSYKVIMANITPVSDGVAFYVRVGTGAGPTYLSGATDYYWVYHQAAITSGSVISDGANGDYSDSEIEIANSLGTGTYETCDGELAIIDPSDGGNFKSIQFQVTFETSADTLVSAHGSGRYRGATTAITALRFLMSSGNIASGEFRLYGLKDA